MSNPFDERSDSRSTNEILISSLGEMRGELKGFGRQLERVEEGVEILKEKVGCINSLCAQRGEQSKQMIERLKDHSDAIRWIRDKEGKIIDLERVTGDHTEQLSKHAAQISRLSGRNEAADSVLKAKVEISKAWIAAGATLLVGIGGGIATLLQKLGVF